MAEEQDLKRQKRETGEEDSPSQKDINALDSLQNKLDEVSQTRLAKERSLLSLRPVPVPHP